jgi:hypothetical protein
VTRPRTLRGSPAIAITPERVYAACRMSTKDDARDAALAKLSDEPPPTFVARRKTIARELKARGAAPAAKAVLARKRPTWTSWALGRLARRDADTLHEVIAAHAALASAVTSGEKIATAQTAFSRALEAAGKVARGEMGAAGHAGAAGEARKLRAALRQIAEQGEHALDGVAAGNFAEPMDDAADGDGGTGADDDDGGFLAAAAREKARLDKERRETEVELARAEKAARSAAERVDAAETELTEAIAARKEADAQVRELKARMRASSSSA